MTICALVVDLIHVLHMIVCKKKNKIIGGISGKGALKIINWRFYKGDRLRIFLSSPPRFFLIIPLHSLSSTMARRGRSVLTPDSSMAFLKSLVEKIYFCLQLLKL